MAIELRVLRLKMVGDGGFELRIKCELREIGESIWAETFSKRSTKIL